MKKILFLSSILLIISCVRTENCETEIIEGLVYKNDKIYTGKCAFYDDNSGGMISSHQFNNGKFHGKWKFSYPSGQLQTVGKFDNGLRIGKWNYYHENGKKSQTSIYLNGKKHGIWKVYDENGNLTIEQEWNEGVAIRDTTRLNNIFEDIKIDGYDVKPIIIDPNLD